MRVLKVADDPALVAELLLLVRLLLSESDATDRQDRVMHGLCCHCFELDGDAFKEIADEMEVVSRAITPAQTIAVFRAHERQRRVELADAMQSLADAIPDLAERRVRLMGRVLDILDLTPADLPIRL